MGGELGSEDFVEELDRLLGRGSGALQRRLGERLFGLVVQVSIGAGLLALVDEDLVCRLVEERAAVGDEVLGDIGGLLGLLHEREEQGLVLALLDDHLGVHPADGAFLRDEPLDLRSAAVLDPVLVAEVAGDEPRLFADHRVDAVGGLLGELQDVRLQLLEETLDGRQLVIGHVVDVVDAGGLAHVGDDLFGLVLDDDAALVLRVQEHAPRVGRRGHVGDVVVDADRGPAERVAEVALGLRPDRELPCERIQLRGDLELVDVERLDEPLGVVGVGHPQGVARHLVELPLDLLELGEPFGVAGELADLGDDLVGGLDGLQLGVDVVVAPGHPVERPALGRRRAEGVTGGRDPAERDRGTDGRGCLQETTPRQVIVESTHASGPPPDSSSDPCGSPAVTTVDSRGSHQTCTSRSNISSSTLCSSDSPWNRSATRIPASVWTVILV